MIFLSKINWVFRLISSKNLRSLREFFWDCYQNFACDDKRIWGQKFYATWSYSGRNGKTLEKKVNILRNRFSFCKLLPLKMVNCEFWSQINKGVVFKNFEVFSLLVHTIIQCLNAKVFKRCSSDISFFTYVTFVPSFSNGKMFLIQLTKTYLQIWTQCLIHFENYEKFNWSELNQLTEDSFKSTAFLLRDYELNAIFYIEVWFIFFFNFFKIMERKCGSPGSKYRPKFC